MGKASNGVWKGTGKGWEEAERKRHGGNAWAPPSVATVSEKGATAGRGVGKEKEKGKDMGGAEEEEHMNTNGKYNNHKNNHTHKNKTSNDTSSKRATNNPNMSNNQICFCRKNPNHNTCTYHS